MMLLTWLSSTLNTKKGTLVPTLAICILWQTCMQKSLECWHKPNSLL
uniref:Alternative protein FRY n=1 Tax=Homo sapiens TaxID=9606 RepID=L8EB55_HUMAN|nr:alternative protein FRY [Homo sapiens]